MKRKLSRYLHWHVIVFNSNKFTELKTDILQRLIMRNIDIFSPFSCSVITWNIINVIIWVLSSCLQCKIPIPKEKSWEFFVISNKHSLNLEVFINIEWFKKICCKNVLGYAIAPRLGKWFEIKISYLALYFFICDILSECWMNNII